MFYSLAENEGKFNERIEKILAEAQPSKSASKSKLNMYSYSGKHCLFSIFLLLFGLSQPSQAQKVTTCDILYGNYLMKDTLLNDSLLQNYARTIFFGSYDSLGRILLHPEDTGYYASVREIIFVYNKNMCELNLYNIEKRKDTYYLKCALYYKLPDDNTSGLLGFVNLPFILNSKTIKFKTFFSESSRSDFVRYRHSNIFSNVENKKNLPKIFRYINQTAAQFSIPYSTTDSLFYLHYSKGNSPYTALGIDDYIISAQGRVASFGKKYVIFDQKGKGFYKHELTHFVTAGKLKSPFLNEGFASYRGGSSSICDNKCDWEKLLGILERSNSDSIFYNIVNYKYINGFNYGFYYYPLASFTVALMIDKYGNGFLENDDIKPLLNSKATSEMLNFISTKLNTGKELLRDLYIGKLKIHLKEIALKRRTAGRENL